VPTCAFCGYFGKLTGEHVFGDWVARSGLDLEPVPHGAGPLNHVGKLMGTRPPFRQTVKDVCGTCNHGWMSRLESMAQRVLTPCILGQPSQLSSSDLGAVAAWTQKTALTAMLVSAEEDRATGYGLSPDEYHALHRLRDDLRPLPASQFWLGRYVGGRGWSVRVTPLVIEATGMPEPEAPQGYAMTVFAGRDDSSGRSLHPTSARPYVDDPPPDAFDMARGGRCGMAERRNNYRYGLP
jgi:hypothetical protein